MQRVILIAICLLLACAVNTDGARRKAKRDAVLDARFNDLERQLAMHLVGLNSRLNALEEKVMGMEILSGSDWSAPFNGLEYKVFEERRTWAHAESACRSMGASLAKVHNKATNDRLSSLLAQTKTSNWAWINRQTRRGQKDVEFHAFLVPERVDACVVVDTVADWYQRRCGQLRPFICERPVKVQAVTPAE